MHASRRNVEHAAELLGDPSTATVSPNADGPLSRRARDQSWDVRFDRLHRVAHTAAIGCAPIGVTKRGGWAGAGATG